MQLSAQGSQLKVPTLSPFAEAKQEVGLTTLELSYARPSKKGRTVFGDLVPYGKIWRTGANASTKLTFSEEVKIGGNALASIKMAHKWAQIAKNDNYIGQTKLFWESLEGGN